jgi:aspartate carbamoyltransferase catalytic subunit
MDPLDAILAAMFYEPSTRTRLSFEAAMLRLGGQVTGFAQSTSSSAAKGESLADSVRIVSGYADVIVTRHPLEGAGLVAARASKVPVINGGDGAHLHPTQTLTDLFLLQRRKGRIGGLKVGLLGDLRHGRTVHSLAPALARLGAEVVCIAPSQLGMPRPVLKRVAEAAGALPRQVQVVDEVVGSLDALYVTRVQKERFEEPGGHQDVAGAYRVDEALLAKAPPEMLVMHPLPRVDEIDPAVDDDPRAVYFEQADGGVPVRMALIAAILGLNDLPKVKVDEHPLRPLTLVTDVEDHCDNERCVTVHEPNVPPEYVTFAGETVCAYCERPIREGA